MWPAKRRAYTSEMLQDEQTIAWGRHSIVIAAPPPSSSTPSQSAAVYTLKRWYSHYRRHVSKT